jgi:hypothetical protein
MNIKHLKIETKDVGKLRFWILPLIVFHILLILGCVSNQSPPPAPPPVRTEPEPPKLFDPGRGRATEIFLPFHIRERVGTGTKVNTRWYKLELEEPVKLNIELQIDEGDQALELQVMEHYARSTADSIRIDRKEKISGELTKGTYYIRVYVTDDSYGSSYQLKVDAVSLQGSSMDNPQYLEPGITLNDTVDVLEGIRVRWYAFEIQQLSGLVLKVISKKTGQDIEIKLRNAQGNILANGRGTGVTKRIKRKLQPGNYFLEIRPAENTNHSEYSISLKTYPIPVKELTGPGSGKENAIEIPQGENSAIGKMGKEYGSIERWYWFDIAKRVSMNIRFGLGDSPTQLYIELFDDSGVVLNSESLEEEKNISRIVDKGRYFLRCFSKGNRGETQYWFEIKFTDDPGAGFIPIKKTKSKVIERNNQNH